MMIGLLGIVYIEGLSTRIKMMPKERLMVLDQVSTLDILVSAA